MDMQDPPISQRQRMLKIGTCVLKLRKLSAQEAAYRLSELQLTYSSCSVVSINTNQRLNAFVS